MNGELPWYKSQIIQQQLVALIVAVLGLLGVTTDVDWNVTVTAIFAGIAALVPIWTIVTRLFKPAPNLTATAATKERQLIATGVLPKQRGFANVWLLSVLALAGIGLLGCPAGLNPVARAETLEQKVYAGYGTVTIFAERGAAMILDPTLTSNVKTPIALAIRSSKPVADKVMKTLLEVASLRAEIAGGATQDERLMIAVTNLNRYYLEFQPLVAELVKAVTVGLRCGKKMGAEYEACVGGAA